MFAPRKILIYAKKRKLLFMYAQNRALMGLFSKIYVKSINMNIALLFMVNWLSKISILREKTIILKTLFWTNAMGSMSNIVFVSRASKILAFVTIFL
jgi:hypothetical protein